MMAMSMWIDLWLALFDRIPNYDWKTLSSGLTLRDVAPRHIMSYYDKKKISYRHCVARRSPNIDKKIEVKMKRKVRD